MSQDFYILSQKSQPKNGDVIFARYATIGTVCFVNTDIDFLVSYSCVTLKPNNSIIGKYLFYYLKSNAFVQEINQFVKINTQGNIGVESIKRAHIMLPTIEEQKRTVQYLDNSLYEIDSENKNKQKQIDHLYALKARLISDVVTGKIDVRGVEVPEFAPVEEEVGTDMNEEEVGEEID